LQGNRKELLERGSLGDDENVLSSKALRMGIERIIELSKGERAYIWISCIALERSEK
jgi:hypothetical protein